MKRTLLLACVLLVAVGCSRGTRHGVVSTRNAPVPGGPYSQAILAGGTLYVAGQLPIDPATGQMVAGGIEAQTHQVLKNIRAIVESAGFTLEDVVQCQIFLKDMDDFERMNSVYASYFPEKAPARAAVEVDSVPLGARIEILATAHR
jgi:2-iminobutanoate/2-iminopropanoate deaminase